jgi:hypothetical protein
VQRCCHKAEGIPGNPPQADRYTSNAARIVALANNILWRRNWDIGDIADMRDGAGANAGEDMAGGDRDMTGGSDNGIYDGPHNVPGDYIRGA